MRGWNCATGADHGPRLPRLQTAGPELYQLETLLRLCCVGDTGHDSVVWLPFTYMTQHTWSLLRNFLCVTRMLCNPRNSLPTSPLFNRIHVNTSNLLNKSEGKPLTTRKGLKTRFFSQRLKLCQFKIKSKRAWGKFILKYSVLGRTIIMVKGFLPIQVLLVTSVSERAKNKVIENPMKTFWWRFIQESNERASKMGNQKSCYFVCEKYDSINSPRKISTQWQDL